MPEQPHKPLQPELFCRVVDGTGQERVLAASSLKNEKARPKDSTKLFCAVHSERWPAGLVPVFQVAEGKGFALKRLPVAGEANLASPCFLHYPSRTILKRQYCVGIGIFVPYATIQHLLPRCKSPMLGVK